MGVGWGLGFSTPGEDWVTLKTESKAVGDTPCHQLHCDLQICQILGQECRTVVSVAFLP